MKSGLLFEFCFVLLLRKTTFRPMRAKILNASAGSGKTYQLAYKYVRDVVERPSIYRHILAVTFTNKATEEMKTRILKEIHALASGTESSYLSRLCEELQSDADTIRERATEARSRILHDYSRFTVLTIDTFFQRILRAFVKELGIDLNYNVEIETAPILAQSTDSLIESISDDKELLQWLSAFVRERIDEGRKWDVRDSILSFGNELFKEENKSTLATTHTRQELERIVHEAAKTTENARQELQQIATKAVEIITSAGLSYTDFTNKSRSFARYFFTIASGEITAYSPTVGRMSRTTEGWCAKNSPALPLVGQLQPLLVQICNLYDRYAAHWNTYQLLRENFRSFALLTDLYTKVQQLCAEQNLMLLSETKHILSKFIGNNDAPFIYEKVGNRFEHFMIDEFQDTSTKEWENFLPLLQNAMAQANDHENPVFIVGDIKQSIYRWRGGDWKLLYNQARQALGTSQTEVITLQDNFRSLPVIVDFNNRAMARLVALDNRKLNTLIDEAVDHGHLSQTDYEELHNMLANAYQNHSQHARRKDEYAGYVSIETFHTQPPVVERICQLIDKGFRPCDILILVRNTGDGVKVASELLDFKNLNTEERYRFDVMTQEALTIGSAPVCSFVAATLRQALNTNDGISRAICNQFLGRDFETLWNDEELAFFRSLQLLSPEEAFERIVIYFDLAQSANNTAYLQAFHEQIVSFCTNRIADIPLFLRWWEEQGSNRSLSIEQSTSTIEISTIHKAKGLEKRAIIIPYCSWDLKPKTHGFVQNIIWAEAQGDGFGSIGRFPVYYKSMMKDSAFSATYFREQVYSHIDNINLLYVALTRAAESLHIFVPETEKEHIGKLLLQTLSVDISEQSSEKSPNFNCHYFYENKSLEKIERFEYGEFTGPIPNTKNSSDSSHFVLDFYHTTQADLRLRLPAQRYFEEGETDLSPRNFGILMHKTFQNADTETEIHRAVQAMQEDGILSPYDAAILSQRIDHALSNPTVREWFDGSWERICREQEIILPHASTTRRPDRVMIRDNRAIVVDYKFGSQEAEKNRKQLREYIQLLREMGYTVCEGYLWYVKLGEIEKIEDAC